MPNELANLMFIAVNGKKIAEDKVSHVEIRSEYEAPDEAQVTITDSELKGNEYQLDQRLEVKLQSKDYGNAHLFDGKIVNLVPKFESGGIKQLFIRGFSPKRVWQMPTVHGKEIPLQVPKSRVERLVFRVVYARLSTGSVAGWDPPSLVREPQEILRVVKEEKDRENMLRMELQLGSPSAKEIASYTLDKYLQINVLYGAFKNPRGIVRGVTISADREQNAVKLILDLRGPADVR